MFFNWSKLLQITIFVIATIVASSETLQFTKPNCQYLCGNVSIPYPFGIGQDCGYPDINFNVICNDSDNQPIPFWSNTGTQIRNITLDGKFEVSQYVAKDCYNESGLRTDVSFGAFIRLSKFIISDTKNKFITIGCDTYATVSGYIGERQYTTGCITLCNDTDAVVTGSCSGVGCCQTSIPKGMKNITVSVSSFGNYTSVYNLSSCGFAFVTTVEDEYDFSVEELKGLKTVERVPLVLDWAVGNKSCGEATKGPSEEFLCAVDSQCVNAENGSTGYTCKCLDGYEGNPYLPKGCKDINECKNEKLNECVYAKECENTVGNYTCGCPERHHGDGRKGGEGCVPDQTLLILITVGTCSGIIALLVGSGWIYLIHRKRKFIKLQELYFKQNGGLMLQQRLSRQDSSIETAQIFTADELKKATNNYDEARIVGSGGFGTVYKGILPANRFQKGGQGERLVAIKKSKIVDRSQIEQFINEVIVLSQINHRNVVKLLGCCLQTEVPLLVYEFVSNGTLSDHIHGESKASGLTWDTRLRIAAETAGVLSYLHSAASTPIIHRDVKSTNILLDENYTAKVSDFGTSRLVPVDQTQLSTMVQGTLGYLDPEYLLTSELTEKSDVYSFGVLVVELLTAQKALSFDRPENERSLAMYFLLALKEERMFESLDNYVLKDGSIEQLKEVAGLVKRCLTVRGEERPTMKEVAMELEGIRMMGQHPWVQNDLNSDENVHLLGETSDNYNYGESVNLTTVYDSMRGHVILPEGNGR